MKNKIELSYIEYKNRHYSFWKPLCFIVEKSDQIDLNILEKIRHLNPDQKIESNPWVCHNSDIQLVCWTENFSDLLKEICIAFDYLYREIAMKDDSKLDVKAKIIKKRILNVMT